MYCHCEKNQVYGSRVSRRRSKVDTESCSWVPFVNCFAILETRVECKDGATECVVVS
jgi:hypothetical protein